MNDVTETASVRRYLRPLGLLTALALTAAACGSSGAETTAAAPTTAASEASDAEGPVADADEPSSDAAVADLSNYPALAVTDVSSGETVELASVIAASETPVLLWFWAPH